MATIVALAIVAVLLFIAWKGYLDATWKVSVASTVFWPLSVYLESIVSVESFTPSLIEVFLPVIVFMIIAIWRGDRTPKRKTQKSNVTASNSLGTITLSTTFFHSPYGISTWNQGLFGNGIVYQNAGDSRFEIGHYKDTSICPKNQQERCGYIYPAKKPGGEHYIILSTESIHAAHTRMIADARKEDPAYLKGKTLRAPTTFFCAHFYTDSNHILDNETDEIIATFTGDAYGAAAAFVCMIFDGDIQPYKKFYRDYVDNMYI